MRITIVIIALVCLAAPAFAQRTGGSFGGSAWGSRPSSSSRPSYSPSVYRSTPTYRSTPMRSATVTRPAPSFSPTIHVWSTSAHRPSGVTRSLLDDDDTPSSADDGSNIDFSDFDPMTSAVCAGIGFVILAVLVYMARNPRPPRWMR